MDDFDSFFQRASGLPQPFQWQRSLAQDLPGNRLIRIPTGFGKTLGVLSAWAWHRIHLQDQQWPCRLVWCLPMRVLVEQTRDEVHSCLERLGLLWADDPTQRDGRIGVHLLMGGADSGEWPLHPEHCAVLIGTQDMLLSRAMNRGYASPRARWPMEFGLLNQDCLWVMDEVQLMDVGLATSGQLQAFREDDTAAGKIARPCFTWWMSATLQLNWLARSPETASLLAAMPETRIQQADRGGHLWDDVEKPCSFLSAANERAFARLIVDRHLERGSGTSGPTLVVVNTVERATEIASHIRADRRLKNTTTDVRLVHSRFRPAERRQWRELFLHKQACLRGAERIIVATQVIEAGVDISTELLITELAPWSSLVQRFGRCARWGGLARTFVVDVIARNAAPYTPNALDAARDALAHLPDVAPLHLESFEERHPDLLPDLYPCEPPHLLLRHELDELFDTTPDLSGADIDISRFIRAGEERDLQVFWVDLTERQNPPPDLRPTRDALCAVPFLKARDWLCGKETGSTKAPRLRKQMRAWVWDWLVGEWKTPERRDLYPGQAVLVAAACGGYDRERGWNPENPRVDGDLLIGFPDSSVADMADAAQDDESLSEAVRWQTIATHGRQVAHEVLKIARYLTPEHADILDLAGRWHDAGKVHVAFNGSIIGPDRPARHDLAKAPKENWLRGKALYPMPGGSRRPGFRHELASTLALFGVLRRHRPDHPALLGPWLDLLEQARMPAQAAPPPAVPPTPLEQEILALDADRFDLLAYLVCSHHGKVRLTWHACPADQAVNAERLRIRGIDDGERLPGVLLAAGDGGLHSLPETALDLTPAAAGLNPKSGAGWTERVLRLLGRHGPFTLAWLEALLRAADQRASRSPVADPLLENDHGPTELDAGDRTLAQAAGNREARDSLAEDTAQRGGEHGVRGRAGGFVHAGSGTRPPVHATRYLETAFGILTYAQLAPHLALAVQNLEAAIEAGEFDTSPIDDELIAALHRRLCAELTPQLAGWRRIDVVVGAHTPPDHHRVPALVREYGRDLEARLTALSGANPEILLETLAFAEGRLLTIHPFADFNGRLTRVLLRLLLRRLDLPWVALAPPAGKASNYLEALSSADRNDWRPLMAVWRERFEQEIRA